MKHSRPLFLLIGFLCALLIGAGAAYAYDQSQKNEIAKGVTVAGVDVGGMNATQARVALERKMAPALSQPVVVTADGEKFTLTARQARLAVNVQASVDEALAASRDGSIVERTTRSLAGRRLNESVTPPVTYSAAAVARFVAHVRRKVDRKPKDASVAFSSTSVQPEKGKDGLTLQAAALRRDVAAVLASGTTPRIVTATVTRTKPKITRSELAREYPVLLTVDRSTFKLRLFKDLKLVKTYTVAVGQPAYPTPTGLFSISGKQVDPIWSVPNSPWAAELAGTTVEGGSAANPLKSRWMGIHDGAGIHGTDNTGSLGSAASHGCVRMAVPDVIELYDQVPDDTPIYIA